MEEPELSDLDDAIIEDSITCRRCGMRSNVADGFSFPSNSDHWVCEECTQDEIDDLARERDAALTALDEVSSREAELIRKIHRLEEV